MEKLNKNNPRFCAKYIKKIGLAKEQKNGWYRVIKCDSKYFLYQGLEKQYSIGDNVVIAKRVPLPGSQWTIHEVKLCEEYWYYESFMNRSAKDQRKTIYEPKARTWFDCNTYIVQEVSLEKIQRLLRK